MAPTINDPVTFTPNTFSMENSDTITFAATNPAADNTPVIYVNTSATLNVTLGNSTGGNISLDASSSLEIFMPMYFTTAQVQGMSISDISMPGWDFSYNSTDVSLMLKYSGASGSWDSGTDLTFNINVVLATASPTSDSIQVNFSGLTGTNVPPQVYTPLALNNPVTPSQVSLADVIQTNLDNQGNVFVSVATDPLTNTIFLNLKNIGDTALYTGGSIWTGKPQVTVSFVYGTTSGSLAPADKSSSTSLGSAWKIGGAISVDPNGWTVKNPSVSDQSNTPAWILKPSSTNLGIIGTGDSANETFAFSNVVSLTPTGHTQMYVQFSGFSKDSDTTYADQLFILDIVKQDAPPTRGLISFFSTESNIVLAAPTSGIQIPLRWSMYFVDSVLLVSSVSGIAAINKDYPAKLPLDQDTQTVTLPQTISQDTPIFLTMQAFSGNGGYLNSMQFAVMVTANFFTDLNGKVYPTVQLNNQIWMAANLDYNAPSGSVPYDNNTGNEAKYGLLYTADAAQASAPAGWRLPTQGDWLALINSFGSAAEAYAALSVGGSSGFNADLGGFMNGTNSFASLGSMGYYWTSSANSASPGNTFGILFAGPPSSTVSTANSYPNSNGLSVRYVKNT